MKINDLVYVYMFDLNVSLSLTNNFVKNKFGKIKSINKVSGLSNDEKALVYEVELLNKNIVTITTYDMIWNIISLSDLKEKVKEVVEDKDVKQRLIEQIDTYLKEQE